MPVPHHYVVVHRCTSDITRTVPPMTESIGYESHACRLRILHQSRFPAASKHTCIHYHLLSRCGVIDLSYLTHEVQALPTYISVHARVPVYLLANRSEEAVAVAILSPQLPTLGRQLSLSDPTKRVRASKDTPSIANCKHKH